VGDWNLVSRALIPFVVSVDGYIEGTPEIPKGSPSNDHETGLVYINYSLYFSPAKASKMIWGLGPSITMPIDPTILRGQGRGVLVPQVLCCCSPSGAPTRCPPLTECSGPVGVITQDPIISLEASLGDVSLVLSHMGLGTGKLLKKENG
jgi:hypothetical protein